MEDLSYKIFENSEEFENFCDRVLSIHYVPTQNELDLDYQFDGDVFFLVRRHGLNYLIYKEEN